MRNRYTQGYFKSEECLIGDMLFVDEKYYLIKELDYKEEIMQVSTVEISSGLHKDFFFVWLPSSQGFVFKGGQTLGTQRFLIIRDGDVYATESDFL